MIVKKEFLYLIFTNILVFTIGIWQNVNILFLFAFIILLSLIYYASSEIENRSMLFAFLLSFALFLIGKDFLQQFFHYKVEKFNDEILNHTFLSYIVALASLGLGYAFFEKSSKFKYNEKRPRTYSESYINTVRKLSVILFCVSILFAIVSEVAVIRFVGNFGYHEYYTDYSEILAGNSLLYAVSKIELMLPISLAIYMATMPKKKEFYKIAVFYAVYLMVSLMTGQRGKFMLGVLWILVYIIFRSGTNQNEIWFQRRYLLSLIVVFPAIAIVSSIISFWREGTDYNTLQMWTHFVDFFYSQGTSTNAVKRAYEFADQIPKGYIYSFEFLRSGILARILGIPIYHGNNVEHALYGGSFTHALGYVVMGTSYLAGHGAGSSYIAELYYDFGQVGVAVGSLIYSWLFVNISNISKKSPFVFSLCLTVVTQLLWAPRGSFSGFITTLFYPTTWIAYLLIFGGAKMLTRSRRFEGES